MIPACNQRASGRKKAGKQACKKVSFCCTTFEKHVRIGLHHQNQINMQLELSRTYFPHGTNGTLYNMQQAVCNTIELPWKENLNGVSCIPAGRYALARRYSAHLQWHLWIKDVPGREYILIHPANDAMKELRGCIAPVAVLTGEGRGIQSRDAFRRLTALVFPLLEQGQSVWLAIN
jgi:hypothetical protein